MAPLGSRNPKKCGLTTAPGGIFGPLPSTRFPVANPSNCCTWGSKCIIAISENFPHSLRAEIFPFRFPTIWPMVARKWPRLRSVAPRLWRFPGITARKPMLRDEQKYREILPINRISLDTIEISGAPNTAHQCEITVSRTIPAVCAPFFFVPINIDTGNREQASRTCRNAP